MVRRFPRRLLELNWKSKFKCHAPITPNIRSGSSREISGPATLHTGGDADGWCQKWLVCLVASVDWRVSLAKGADCLIQSSW